MRTGREVAVFVYRDGNVLLLRRSRDGIWHIPAGVVEDGESYAAAARRELAEETGLRDTAGLIDLGCSQKFTPASHQRSEYPAGLREVALENFALRAPMEWQPHLDAEHVEYQWRSFDDAEAVFHWDQARQAFVSLRALLRGTTAARQLAGRSSELWSRISMRVEQLRELLAAIPDERLATVCAAEGWPIALVGCHVSLGLRRQANWVRRVLAGSGPTVFDWERTHALNALIARRVSLPTKAAVLDALADGAARWGRLLEVATDEDLARMAFRRGETLRPVAWVADVVAPRHIDEHARSIRAALGKG